MLARLALNQFVKSYSTQQTLINDKTPFGLGKERSLNQVQIIGRVGSDPKIDSRIEKLNTATGEDKDREKKIATFTIATNEYNGVDDDGNSKTRVDWHRIVVFNNRLCDTVQKHVRQGDRIHVTGKIHYNLIKDDTSGLKRFIPSINADDIIFLTKNNKD